MLQDLIKALRILKTSPGFALLAAGTLALGIGLNAALFGVVNGVLLAPLPYPQPDRVMSVNTVFTDEKRNVARVTGGDLLDLAAEPDLFEAFGYYGGGQVGLQMRDRAEFAGVAFVNPGFFPVFGVTPRAGRWFSEADRADAIVSEGFANRNFGAAEAALGQTVSVENTIYQIAGVVGGALDFPKNTDVWVQAPSKPENTNRSSYNYRAVARLAPGVSREVANTRLAALGARLGTVDPADNKHKSFIAIPLRDQLTGSVQTTLYILMSAVGLVLLIACANVANLLLARATGRSREMAVRAAMGATRWRVIRQLLTENLVLALLGAAGGIALAYWGVDVLLQLAPAGLPRTANIGVSPAVLGFAIAMAVAAAFVSGVTPALELSRVDLIESLKQGGRGSTASGSANRMRYALVVAEIALSVILAVGSGLLFRTFLSLNAVELGFEKDQVLVMYAHAPAKGLEESVKATRTFDNLMPKLGAMPGVLRVAAAMGMPAGQYSSDGMYEIEGQPPVADWRQGPQALFRLSSPNYFATLGIPMLRGRDFAERDSYTVPFVAIISESLARKSFPDSDPIGKQIRCGLDSPNWMTIVGVVRDVRSLSPATRPEPELYMPLAQHPYHANEIQIAMRIAPGMKPEALSEAARAKVREENPAIAVRFTTLDAMLAGAIDGQRFRAFLLTAFAGIAVMLAMAGVYGVMSYVITQRLPEMGLRMALGAGPLSLLRLMLGRAAWLAAAGLAIGLTGTVAASRVLEGMLFGLKPIDAGTYVVVSALVLAVTVMSALGPAWRATRVDPLMALRQE
jgi:putative ABC transport system permease protein